MSKKAKSEVAYLSRHLHPSGQHPHTLFQQSLPNTTSNEKWEQDKLLTHPHGISDYKAGIQAGYTAVRNAFGTRVATVIARPYWKALAGHPSAIPKYFDPSKALQTVLEVIWADEEYWSKKPLQTRSKL